MKFLSFLSYRKFLFSFFVAIFPISLTLFSSDLDKVAIKNDFYLQYNDITGPGKKNSSLVDGLRYFNIFNYYKKGKLKKYKYIINLGLKATDNRKKDPKDISITNMQITLKNKINTFRVGDVFESFSQYSLNTALKGVSYRYLSKDITNQLQIVYGIAYPRWDSFWDNKTKAIKRSVYGTRYRRKILDGKMDIGVSFVYSNDKDRIFGGVPLYNNHLYTMDINYIPIPDLDIYSEFSHSNNTKNTSDTTANENFSGNAFKIRAIGNKNPSRVLVEYERVSPYYITLTGSATPDREKFKTSWRYKATKKIVTHIGFLWYRNDLDGQLIDRKDVYRPSIGITYKKAFGRRHNTIDLTYKLDITDTTNNITNHIIDFSMSDRFAKIYNTTNISYYSYKTDGNIQDSHEFRINTQFNGKIRKKDYIFKPSLYIGSRSNKDELKSSLDKYYEASIGLGVDVMKYRLSGKLKIGENKSDRDLSDDSKKVFLNLNIYYRPKIFFSFKRVMIYARAFYNDFTYTTNTKNFRERGTILGVRIRF